jgi:acetoacetyl-CoA synthetase
VTAPPVVCRPNEAEVQHANLTRYRAWLASARNLEFMDYNDLWNWSVTEVEAFWVSMWEYFGVEAARAYDRPLGSAQMQGAEWFPGAELNYAQHIFRDRDADGVAISHASELRPIADWTWGELSVQTARIACGLRALGVQPGDRVALPNIPEAVAAFLACASIGAVWSSASPDFGPKAVSDRFAQIEPKVLLAVDGYKYGGRRFDRRAIVRELRASMPSLQRTVLLAYLDDNARLNGTIGWHEFTREARL